MRVQYLSDLINALPADEPMDCSEPPMDDASLTPERSVTSPSRFRYVISPLHSTPANNGAVFTSPDISEILPSSENRNNQRRAALNRNNHLPVNLIFAEDMSTPRVRRQSRMLLRTISLLPMRSLMHSSRFPRVISPPHSTPINNGAVFASPNVSVIIPSSENRNNQRRAALNRNIILPVNRNSVIREDMNTPQLRRSYTQRRRIPLIPSKPLMHSNVVGNNFISLPQFAYDKIIENKDNNIEFLPARRRRIKPLANFSDTPPEPKQITCWDILFGWK